MEVGCGNITLLLPSVTVLSFICEKSVWATVFSNANFIEKRGEFKNFKEFLKSKNITALEYFQYNQLQPVIKRGKVIENNYFLFFPKKLDVNNFLINYAKFIQKNSIIDVKKYYKSIIDD